MRGRDDALSLLVAAVGAGCLLAITAVIIHRALLSRPVRADPQPPERVVRVDNWSDLTAAGHRIGAASAPLTVVVFSDFFCPACAAFATEEFPTLAARYPGQVALIYRHRPLSQHRFSYATARASECAAQEGKFSNFHEIMFVNQDSLGFKTFSDMAAEAGVEDLPAFDSCVRRSDPLESIERDLQAVRALGTIGTPTVIVNGWLLRSDRRRLLDSVAVSILEP